jgi:Dolichyl-phosphate-mannose-protein mannosyltransferase
LLLIGAAFALTVAYALGLLLFRKIPLPAVVLFALGAAVESVLVYLFLLLGLGHYLLALAVFVPFAFFLRPTPISQPPVQPLDRTARWILLPLLSVFGVYYLIHALAPEIQPDAISYHLGLTAEYLRRGAFPNRVDFYEILPQGLEMLFAVAYSIGRDSAAKLVHFSFLLATFPLIVLIARRLKLSDTQGYAAATLYFVAPVVGISGTCAYNDAALVFFTLATFYLLLLWRDHGLLAYAVAAGLTAGFCYAIKFTGLIVPPLAILFVLWQRRVLRPPIFLSLAASAMIAPWMLRALILTRNPVAPLFDTLFPNLYFNPVTERTLAQTLANYEGFHWPSALWDWAFVGHTQSVAGPLILVAPLALLAWCKPVGRLLVVASLLLLVPVAFNVGTRFLMPALPFLALALAVAFSRRVLLALAVLQAIICFPPIINRLQGPQGWTLTGLPWRAALRIQSEPDYLKSATSSYPVARFLEQHTTSKDRIFALNGIATAFTTREVLEYWHSNRAVRLTRALQTAFEKPLTVRAHAEWPPLPLSGIRFVSNADYPLEWTIYEARLLSPGGFIYASPQWHLDASINLSDVPGAFDGNFATSWTSRTPQRRGMFLQVGFDHPQLLDSIEFLIAANAPQAGFVIQGLPASSRKWLVLSNRFDAKVVATQDLRQAAVHAISLAGFTYLTVYAEAQGIGSMGRDMVRHPWQWGLQDAGGYGVFHLMRIVAP